LRRGLLAVLAGAAFTAHGQTMTVTGQAPTANAVGVPLGTSLGLTFSQTPTAASVGTVKVFSMQAGGLRSLGAATIAGTTATMPVLGGAFRPGETVRVTVPASVMSSGGTPATPYVYQFITGTTGSAGTFGLRRNFPTDFGPGHVALGDLSGDGIPDIVTSNTGTDPSNNVTTQTAGVMVNGGTGTFGAATNYYGNGYVNSVALGDINNDGRLDLVTAVNNSFSNIHGVQVSMGLAGGGLGTPTYYSTDFGPGSLALGDINGDGKLDIVTGNSSVNAAGSTSVLLSLPAGGFAPKVDYTVGSYVGDLELADVNNDGLLDLLVINNGGAVLRVRYGQVGGTFSSVTSYTIGANPQDLATGDFTGDGLLDIAVTNTTDGTVGLFAGRATGGFVARVNYPVAASPNAIAAGDVNGDGRLDLVTSHSAGSVSVLLGRAAGGFDPYASYVTGAATDVALADVNGDGRLDVVTPNYSTNNVSVLYALSGLVPTISSFTPTSGPAGTTLTVTGTNLTGATLVTFTGTSGNTVTSGFTVNANGTQLSGLVVPGGAQTGTFSITTPGGVVTSSTAFTVVPYNLLSVTPTPNSISVPLAAASAPSFTFNLPPGTSLNTTTKVFGSVSGGVRSLSAPVISGNTGTVTVTGPALRAGERMQVSLPTSTRTDAGAALSRQYVYQYTAAAGAASGTLGARTDVRTTRYPRAVAVGDVTGDGIPDIITAHGDSLDRQSFAVYNLTIRAGLPGGGYGARTIVTLGSKPYVLKLGDMNNDGILDMVTANGNFDSVFIVFGSSTGNFTDMLVDPQREAQDLALGDIDGNGRLDVITTGGFGNSSVSVNYNFATSFGNGVSFSTNIYSAGTYTSRLAVGDVNNDGALDVAVTHGGDGTGSQVSVLLNNGRGLLGSPTPYTTGTTPRRVELADMTGDGRLDIITVNTGAAGVAANITVLPGLAAGGFGAPVGYTTGNSMLGLTTADMNGDGRLDLVTTGVANNLGVATVQLGLAGGGFGSPINHPTIGQPVDVVAADYNGDGRLDLAVANLSVPGWASMLLGDVTPAPTLTSVAPGSGQAGTTITLTGTGLTGATALTLNGTPITGFTVNGVGTTITLTLPAGSSSGYFVVTTPGGTATAPTIFTVTAPQLAVTQGATAYASGSTYAFGTETVGNPSVPVSFTLTNAGTAPLTITGVTLTGDFARSGSAPAVLAAGGGTGTVSVVFTPTAGGVRTGTLVIQSSLGTYTVNLTGNGQAPVPTLTVVSPARGAVGSTVTLIGTGLTGASSLTLNGMVITGFVVNAAGTSITFTVPAGALAGPIVVTTPGGTATSTSSFCVQYTPTATGASRCDAGTLTLQAAGAPAGGTYAWYDQATGGTALAGATGATFTTPSISTSTTYYVAISAGSGCEGSRVPVQATVGTTPTVQVTAGGATTICPGSSVTLTASGAASYRWSTGATTASITVSAAGSYTVTGTSATGNCSATSAPVTVTLAPAATASITAGGPTSFCQGGSVVLTANGTSGSTFVWSNGATTPSITVSTTGTYTVTATTAGGCSATSVGTAVTVNAVPAQPTISQVASGGSIVLTSSASTGNQWYLGGVLIPGATGVTYTVNSRTLNGTYTVITTSAAGCSSPASAGTLVLGTAAPAVAAQVQLYPNPTRGQFTVTAPAPARVRVLNALGQEVANKAAAATAHALDLTGLASGLYAVQVQLGSEVVVKRIVLE